MLLMLLRMLMVAGTAATGTLAVERSHNSWGVQKGRLTGLLQSATTKQNMLDTKESYFLHA